ncbi:MAG: DUF3794 domain-containing protein [Oscillospiraceae bacterium]|nr:DUF3794 domain-containing protein [Oscillospiraceae bacterium]
MEIVFEKRQDSCFRESMRLSKRLQESVESVVPDTDEDIGRIAAVQSGVLLKSKDLNGRGVLITGEARAWVLCISESRERLTSLRVVKPFSAEFEIPELTGEELTQISLCVMATDARMLNPRKLSVTFDLAAELGVFTAESVIVETAPPQESCMGLHVCCAQEELTLPSAVCEKSFVLNGQYPFPAGKPKPERLIGERTELRTEGCQLIGSKAVVKGKAVIETACLADDGEAPVRLSFEEPFSQILDIGCESMDLCSVQPQLTGAYYDLADSISGEKVLDAELHILLQFVGRSRVSIRSVADAYSNLMPLAAETETQLFESAEEQRTVRISAADSIELTEDCADLLCVFPSLSRCSLENGRLSAAVSFDMLCRSESGEMTALRRTLNPEGDCGSGELRLLNAALTEAELRPAGKNLEARVTLEAQLLCTKTAEIVSISTVTLDEEQAFDSGSLPTLTMVRREGESLWELAKRYHSSVEAIEACAAADAPGGMLLIPKSV